jgi:hypothetical protein
MNDLENDSLDLTSKAPAGLFDSIRKDDGVQRAAAGVLIAAVVAGAKFYLFRDA